MFDRSRRGTKKEGWCWRNAASLRRRWPSRRWKEEQKYLKFIIRFYIWWMTNDFPVPVSGDPESRYFYPYFPLCTLGYLACFPVEADLQDGLNMNCSGHKFFVRTTWGRFCEKSLYLQVKIRSSSSFPCECDTHEFIGSKARRVFKCLIHWNLNMLT